MGDVTELIQLAREGDRGAFDRLFESLYPDLTKIARRLLARGARDMGIDARALVNECYLKFVRRGRFTPSDEAHFLGYAAAVMRSIVVDEARAARTDRRGGRVEHLELDAELIETIKARSDQTPEVHAALESLSRVDARLGRVVEMRYFGGFEETHIAEALGLSTRTVRRDWEKARVLLADALRA
jgi:RNA polymerase sigma factor (TIGR02999 family)